MKHPRTVEEHVEPMRVGAYAINPTPGDCPECGGNCAPECGLHPAGCVYGGFSEYTGYWLVAEDCDRSHGEEPATE